MNVTVSLLIGAYDHPNMEVIAAEDEDDVEAMCLWLSDDISLSGARVDVVRWVRDLAQQVAMQEDGP